MMTTQTRINFVEENNNTIIIEKVSKADKALVWYTASDIVRFSSNNDKHDEEVAKQQGKQERKQFIRSVLNQQREHKDNGISDPKGLSMLSRACSKESKRRAVTLAAEIAAEVYDIPINKVQSSQNTLSSRRRMISSPRRRSITAQSA